MERLITVHKPVHPTTEIVPVRSVEMRLMMQSSPYNRVRVIND